MSLVLVGRERSDRAAVKNALVRVRRETGLPVAFLGRVEGKMLRLTEFDGTRTRGLAGLEVAEGAGLGGRVVAEGRGGSVADYGEARGISHQYDAQVLGEGLHSMVAFPVSWENEPRAVLYAATRSRQPLGDRVGSMVDTASRRLSLELAVQDEVERRLTMLEAAGAFGRGGSQLAGRDLEDVRAVHAELRALAVDVGDERIAARLEVASARLARGAEQQEGPALTAREVDVLALVALGCTNAEVGRRLGLASETIKGYLRSAMRKLDVTTRHEAVVRARTYGHLP